jgi:spore coat polysaccharide biosynthesis protein SpsF
MTAHADVLIVLQARYGSSRLPGKVLAPLDGVSILAHCVRRLVRSGVGPVCLATTIGADDDRVAAAGRAEGVRVVRGEVDDVLARFVAAGEGFDGRFVIRATADNPAVDVEAPGRVLQRLAEGADYVVETGLPYGCAVEGIRLDVMRSAHSLATDAYDREHVTPWIKARPTTYRVVTPEAPALVRRPDLRFTVDTPDDCAYMARVLGAVGAGRRVVPLAEIVGAADRMGDAGGSR